MTPSSNVVHYLPDEKFTDFFVSLMRSEGADGHHFLVDPANADGSLRYTSAASASTVLDPSRPVAAQSLDLLRRARTAVIHFMCPRAQALALALPKEPRLFWSGWGADYYHLMRGGEAALHEPLTADLVRRLDLAAAVGTRARIRCIAKQRGGARIARSLRRIQWNRILSRVDLFSAPIQPDHELLRRAVGRRLRAGYCQINYGSVSRSLARGAVLPIDATLVQIGNSADPIGNHLDAAAAIPAPIRARLRVVAPLSYGRADYAQAVEHHLQTIGFDHVSTLSSFMPIDDYLATVSRCGAAIFHARRQHALGNIGAALWRGARVFLNPASAALGFLQGQGATIESTESLETRLGKPDPEPPASRMARNRLALERLWGEQAVRQNARIFIRETSS